MHWFLWLQICYKPYYLIGQLSLVTIIILLLNVHLYGLNSLCLWEALLVYWIKCKQDERLAIIMMCTCSSYYIYG